MTAWQCSPKFDEALEEMSEWFKDAGEVESTADSCDGSSLPENAECHTVKASVQASSQNHGSDKMHAEHTDPATKPPSQEYAQARDVANRIYSSAKAVLDQSHLEFLQLLTSMDRNKPVTGDGQSGCGSSPIQASSPGMSAQQSDASASEATQWKRRVSKKSSNSVTGSPLSPGLVTRASCCLYGKQEKLQEKCPENRGDLDEVKADKTKSGIMGLTDMDKVKKVATKARSVACSVASEESKPSSPKDSGRVRIRITPKHFSPLGTTFRDVQVDFSPMMYFTIQAVDCEGHVWTARSNMMPGFLAVDRCKYKIDPYGKDVLITLFATDQNQSLKGLERLELIRPYQFEQQAVDSRKNFI